MLSTKSFITVITTFFVSINNIIGQLYINDTLIIYNGSTLSIQENYISVNKSSDSQRGTLALNGLNAQTLVGNGNFIVDSLIIDNSNNITLQTELGAKTFIQFKNGKIITDVNNFGHFLHFLDNATYTGYTYRNYVDGRVRKTGNDNFTFPVGNSSFDAPLSISAPNNLNDAFTAYYQHNPSSNNLNLKEFVLSRIFNTEYWMLSRSNGSSDVSVTLSWSSTRSNTISQLNMIRTAKWNGSQWVDCGNMSTTGNIAQGTITSNIISTFNQFTLADYYCPVAPTLIKRN